jgi:double stranded RNA-specific editase B
VNGQVFEGQWRSKKLAKHAAAEAALRSFVQFKNAPEAQQAMNMHITDLDFRSAGNTEPAAATSEWPAVENGNGLSIHPTLPPARRNSSARLPIHPGSKNPVMLLNELRPGIKFECLSGDGEPYAEFTMCVTIDSETFEGTGKFSCLEMQKIYERC